MAENVQRIQVMQYVPDREGGVLSSDIHKRPLPGVTLEISGAGVIHCDRIGCATITFHHLVEGDHVNLKRISKPGYQLFSIEDLENWYVPADSREVRQILMISNSDMEWIEKQWTDILRKRKELHNGAFSPDEHLMCLDMSQITPMQQQLLPLIMEGDNDRVSELLAEASLFEKYRNAIDGDPKILRDIDTDLQFLALFTALAEGMDSEKGFSLLDAILQFRSNIPWLINYYPDYCHNLRKYEAYDKYMSQMLGNGSLAAADRAYLHYWDAYNHMNDADQTLCMQLEKKALLLYDSIASATKDPDIYPYNRAILSNMLAIQYAKSGDKRAMDRCFADTRRFFETAINQNVVQSYIACPYYAIQAENYWRTQYNTGMVEELLLKASSFPSDATDNTSYLGARLSTIRRIANIHYMRERYDLAYEMLQAIDPQEKELFAKHSAQRAEHYAQFLMLKAQTCMQLGRVSMADEILKEIYSPYDLIDRIKPGNYKKDYLNVHLLHAKVRIATEQNHWARTDLKRAESLADEVYAAETTAHDSILSIIADLRRQVKPVMVPESTAQVRYNPNRLEFAFITDTHNFGRSADIRDADRNIEAFVNYCNEHPAIQVAIHGGDFINSYETNHDNALWNLNRARFQFEGLEIPFYALKGNHDCNGKQWVDGHPDNTQIVTDREFFSIFSPISVDNPLAQPDGIVYNPKERTRNYYYRDFEAQHVRMIFLNAYHRDTLEQYGYLSEQVRWLAEEALDFSQKEDPTEWGFIVFGHNLPVQTNRGINRLLHAYNNGATEHRDSTLYVPFCWNAEKEGHAQMIAVICGHYHIDNYSNSNGYNHITVTRGFATGNEVESDPIAFSHFVIDTKNHTLLEERIGAYHSRLYSYGEKSDLISPRRPFESADGMGNFTTGAGDKGRIIIVTNLNDDGEGSLRWAIAQKGARYVAFSKGGDIVLNSPLVIDNDSITILGQSAPKPVVIRNDQLVIKASEVIVRYLTILPGAKNRNAIQDDHFGQKNIILDHLTVGSTLHSSIALRYVEDATVQRCRIARSLSEEHPALLAGGFKVTYYNNYIQGGNHAVKIPESVGSNRWLHLVRNVIYDWKDHAIYGGANQAEVSITENYLIPSANTQKLKILTVGPDGTSRYYLSHNTINGVEAPSQKDIVIDRTGVPWRMTADIDTTRWNQIPPVARPNTEQYGFSSSCLTIAAFHYKEIDGKPSPYDIYNYVSNRAGNVIDKRPKKAKDRDADGLPDTFATLNAWLKAIEPDL